MEYLYPTRRTPSAYSGPEIDVQVTKAKARQILRDLEAQGVNVEAARRDVEESRSPLYNIYYMNGMTGPNIGYARG